MTYSRWIHFKKSMKKFFVMSVAALLLFSCEKTKTVVVNEKNDTISVKEETKIDSGSNKDKWKTESDDMKKKLEELKEKATTKGGKASKDINEKIDNLENERKGFNTDNWDDKASEKWTKFKEKANQAIDSLDKKM